MEVCLYEAPGSAQYDIAHSIDAMIDTIMRRRDVRQIMGVVSIDPFWLRWSDSIVIAVRYPVVIHIQNVLM